MWHHPRYYPRSIYVRLDEHDQPYAVRLNGRTMLVKVLSTDLENRWWYRDPPRTYYALETQRGRKLVISECEGHWYFGWWVPRD